MIVVPALHPAHDVLVRIDELTPGLVHRVGPDAIATGVGGKAVNVALASAAMDVPVRLVVCGDTAVLEGLRALVTAHPKLELVTIPSPVPTRTDVAVVDRLGRPTVINGTSADPGRQAVGEVVAASLHGLGPDDVLVLAGSTPDGTGDAHAEMARGAASHGTRVVLDASGAALVRLIAARPEAVKVSADEAGELGGEQDVAGDDRPSRLATVPIVGVTDGATGLRAWLPDGRALRVMPPPELAVMASLGAGDAVTAGLAIALAAGDDPLDGFVLGTAMAASTLVHLDASVDRAAVERLRKEVRVIPLEARPSKT